MSTICVQENKHRTWLFPAPSERRSSRPDRRHIESGWTLLTNTKVCDSTTCELSPAFSDRRVAPFLLSNVPHRRTAIQVGRVTVWCGRKCSGIWSQWTESTCLLLSPRAHLFRLDLADSLLKRNLLLPDVRIRKWWIVLAHLLQESCASVFIDSTPHLCRIVVEGGYDAREHWVIVGHRSFASFGYRAGDFNKCHADDLGVGGDLFVSRLGGPSLSYPQVGYRHRS